MRKMMLCGMLGVALLAGSGCTTVAKRTFKEMKGASSDFDIVPGTSVSGYSQYNSVDIKPPTSELGGLVSTSFSNDLVSHLRKELTQGDDAPFRGGPPALTIEPHIMWFNKGGSVFPDKHAIVLYYLKADGVEVGRVQVATKSEASRTGDSALAESSAEELVKFFEKHGKKARKKQSD
jgi:hypothetical protein